MPSGVGRGRVSSRFCAVTFCFQSSRSQVASSNRAKFCAACPPILADLTFAGALGASRQNLEWDRCFGAPSGSRRSGRRPEALGGIVRRRLGRESVPRYARQWRACRIGAGPVGWLDADGDGEFRVALRSALVDADGTTLFAGAGIVAGSDPDRELIETEVKLGALLGPILAASAPATGTGR